MTITLTPELESLVERKVKTGRYHSASEVVREALELLDEKDQVNEARLEELRAEIIKAEDAYEKGAFIQINSEADLHEFGESIMRRGRERLALEKNAD